MVESAKTMVHAVKVIGSASLPFPHYWHHLSERYRNDCRAFDIEKYDLSFVKRELFAFTRKLAKAIKKGKDLDALILAPPAPVPAPVDNQVTGSGENQEKPIQEEIMRVKLFIKKKGIPYFSINWNNWWNLTPWNRKLWAAWLLVLHIAPLVHVIVWVT